MLELLIKKSLLNYCLSELPIQNIKTFVNGYGEQGLRFTCNNKDFSLIKEYQDKDRFELGYWTNEGLEVARYLTPVEVADFVQALSIS